MNYILSSPVATEDSNLRSAIAYLQIHNAWRESQIAHSVMLFEPEPAKLTAAIEVVTRHCLDGLNQRWAQQRGNDSHEQ